MMRVRLPSWARRTPVAAARLVFPTPPFPLKRRIRILFRTRDHLIVVLGEPLGRARRQVGRGGEAFEVLRFIDVPPARAELHSQVAAFDGSQGVFEGERAAPSDVIKHAKM